MNNKIEEGCLAMVVTSYVPENVGKVGTIGEYLGVIEGFTDKDYWVFSTDIKTTHGNKVNFVSGSQLMKINPDAKLIYTEENLVKVNLSLE